MWGSLILIVAGISLVIASISPGGISGWWALPAALFSGLMWAIIVWRSRHTPASAWKNLRRPPREDL